MPMSRSSLAKKLALWKPGWTTDFHAAGVSPPELLLPSSRFFLFLAVAFNLTRALTCAGAGWLLLPGLCSGVRCLPRACSELI